MKKFLFFLGWVLSLLLVSLYTYENPEKIDIIKSHLKQYKKQRVKYEEGSIQTVTANSFAIDFSKVISISNRTAFIVHNSNIKNFNINLLEIYTQDGYLTKNLKSKKLNLPDSFITSKNGGVKTVFANKEKRFALISSLKENCYYASIVYLSNGKELFKSKCLPDEKIDYNVLGSSSLHYNDKILLSIGAPESGSSKIRILAQDNDTVYGKILQISKSDLDQIINNKEGQLNLKIFSKGHRNPQGLAKINDTFFAVEHGPKGGAELNKLTKGKNYGWPEVSYGTFYMYENEGRSIPISHENKKFEEPLFAHVPSIGISGLSACPNILNKYYKKPCLIALSLYGNNLGPGRSLIIYLMSEAMDKVHSIEKIFLRDDLKLRHFVTNAQNEIYEDNKGSIYISADGKGIYKLSFKDFRN